MNIVIVDDSESARQELINYATAYCKENQIHSQIESYENGSEFLTAFNTSKYDIIFLDIYMDGMNGIEIAEKIRKQNSQVLIIFSTTSRSHALDGFRVRASDYLVKPYSYENFKETLSFCNQKLLKHSYYIEVKEGRYYTKLLVDDIVYTDYYNHYIQIHSSSRVIRSYMSFSEFSPMLECYPQFLCCYRNCLINMDRVTSLVDTDFIMESGECIPISRGLKNKVRQAYSDYVFNCTNEDVG